MRFHEKIIDRFYVELVTADSIIQNSDNRILSHANMKESLFLLIAIGGRRVKLLKVYIVILYRKLILRDNTQRTIKYNLSSDLQKLASVNSTEWYV